MLALLEQEKSKQLKGGGEPVHEASFSSLLCREGTAPSFRHAELLRATAPPVGAFFFIWALIFASLYSPPLTETLHSGFAATQLPDQYLV